MKKSQLFSVDFLLAVAVLTLALGIWVNSYSQIRAGSQSDIANASAFSMASDYYSRLSSGVQPSALGCSESAGVVQCDLCVREEKFFIQRIYSSSGGVKMLRVGVCS